MIYPTDFVHHQNQQKRSKNVRNFRISTINLDINQQNSKKKDQTNKMVNSSVSPSEESILIRYLNNSTVHGFRYLTDPTIHRTER